MGATDIVLIKPGSQKQLYGELSAFHLTAIEPPLWAALLAAYLRERGYSVALLDAEVENWSYEETARRISEIRPVLAGVFVSGTNPSASTMNMTGAGAILRHLRSQAPESKTLLAGLHPSALPERTLREEDVDFVCEGEGFYTLPSLIDAIKAKAEDLKIAGLWYRKDGEIRSNPPAPLFGNLDQLPRPAWDLLPMQQYRAHNWHCFDNIHGRQPYAVIYTSLGCPFKCSFCCINALFGKAGIRYRNPERVVQEIEFLVKKYGVRNIKIMDEMFALKESHVARLCDLILEEGYDLNMWAYARVNTVTERMLKKMKQAGIQWVAYGFESGSKKVLQGVTKGYNLDTIDQVVKMTYDAGIHICGNYIFGLPDDDQDSMQETLDLALGINSEWANFYPAMAFPGSKLYEQAIKENRPFPETWQGYSPYAYETLPLPTKYLTGPEVLQFRDEAFQVYFTQPKYMKRITQKFGVETAQYIREMASHRLNRKYLSRAIEFAPIKNFNNIETAVHVAQRYLANHKDFRIQKELERLGQKTGLPPEPAIPALARANQLVPGEGKDKNLREVEFADYLLVPTFLSAVDHPQFKHIMSPPEGYIFTQRPQISRHAEILANEIHHLDPDQPLPQTGHPIIDATIANMNKVARMALQYGGSLMSIRDFFKSRHIEQQARLPEDARLAFIPSVPYSICSLPWLVEIEDSTTLFFPYMHNGQTATVEAASLQCYPILKALLESEMCKAIITHIESTAHNLPALFQSEVIGQKVVHAPLGIRLPDIGRKKKSGQDSKVNLLFTNSWHQDPRNFYLRGGHDVIEAFSILADKYPQVNLIIRSALPPLNAKHAGLVSTHPRIKVLNHFLNEGELHGLMLETDVYLIPAARVHVMSVLSALSYGIPVIASDAWGFADYIDDGKNGFLVQGRYGICSWDDRGNGMLREDYSNIAHPDGISRNLVEGLVKFMSLLIDNGYLQEKMSLEARSVVEKKFSLDRWNGVLKRTLDKIFESLPRKDGQPEISPFPPIAQLHSLKNYADDILAALRIGDSKTAVSLSSEIVYKFYQDPQGWTIRAVTLKALGDYGGALDALNKSLQRGETPEALTELFHLYQVTGHQREAKKIATYISTSQAKVKALAAPPPQNIETQPLESVSMVMDNLLEGATYEKAPLQSAEIPDKNTPNGQGDQESAPPFDIASPRRKERSSEPAEIMGIPHVKGPAGLKILFLPLEFPTWEKARHQAYPTQIGMAEGLRNNKITSLTLPALWNVHPLAPNSWLRFARSLCNGKQFDQVWIEAVHCLLDEDFLDWLTTLAPVRVGFIQESLRYEEETYSHAPYLKGRQGQVEQKLRYLTHAVCADEQDVIDFNQRLGIPALWWPQTVPERFIDELPGMPPNHAAAFYGELYGKRQAWLNRDNLKGLLVRPGPSLEHAAGYPQLYDSFHLAIGARLAREASVDEQFFRNSLDLLMEIRQKCFGLWLQSLMSWYAIVNLPSFFGGYPSRVYESMAAGRPVISWRVKDRPRTNRLFADSQEILLFDKDSPDELVEHIRRLQGDPTLAQRIAMKAQKKIRQFHTLEKRVRQILDWVEKKEEPYYGEAAGPTISPPQISAKPRLRSSTPKKNDSENQDPVSRNTRRKIVAIIAAYNEGDVIYHVIGDLIENGIEVYFIDNSSSDNTIAEAGRWMGKGLIHIERFPQDSGYPERNAREYVWRDLLRRKEEIAAKLDADWYIHADADEFRESPWPGMKLREAIHLVASLGYSAINFEVLNFRPIDNNFVAGADIRKYLTHYEPCESFDAIQIKAWRNTHQPVQLAETGGHEARFPGRRVFPIPFILRHYPIRSEEQGERKLYQERFPRFNQEERQKGWHVQYDKFSNGEGRFLWDSRKLFSFDPDSIRAGILSRFSQDFLLIHELAGGQLLKGALDGTAVTTWTGYQVGRFDPIPLDAIQRTDDLINSLLVKQVSQQGKSALNLIPEEIPLWLAVVRIKEAKAHLQGDLAIARALERLRIRLTGLIHGGNKRCKGLTHREELFRLGEADKAQSISEHGIGQDPTKTVALNKGTVSIVILTLNQLEYTRKCLASIRMHTPEVHEIIFVDNGSTDGTIHWLKKQAVKNPHYRLMENRENLGFAKGCNQGIEAARGEYIVLLNNDVIVTQNWLSGLQECLKGANRIGIVGPMTNNISGPQQVPKVGYSSMADLDEYARSFREKNRYRRIPFRRIVGFCMLFRRELVDESGLLDEGFGTGNFEDDDFCLRAELAGYRNMIAGDVFIHHFGSRSFIGNKIDYRQAMKGNHNHFLEKWNGLDPQSPEGGKYLSLRGRESGKLDYEMDQGKKAVDRMLAVIKLRPEEKESYFDLAEILLDAKQYDQALSVLNQIPDADQDERKYALLGYCQEGRADLLEAERLATQALSLNPQNAMAFNLKGILAYRKGDKEEAQEYFQKAAAADRGYGEPHTNLGVIRWEENQKKEALHLFERGFILSPTITDILQMYHSAITEEAEFTRAEQKFHEAKALHPFHKRIRFFLIDILLKQGKYEEAMEEIEQSMSCFEIEDGILKAALEVRKRIGPQKKSARGRNISLCMIVKDEESDLVKCLRSVKSMVNEMIVVDTGSSDRTKGIATALGAMVFDFSWENDFSAARNFSISQAKGDWILVLDADEMISPLNHASLLLLTKAGSRKAGYSFVTRNYLNNLSVIKWTPNDGAYDEEAGSGWIPSEKVRLFPKDRRIHFENPVHEFVEPSLERNRIPIKKCNIPVHHYGKLNEKKEKRKGEDYFLLGKKKLETSSGDIQSLKELAVQANILKRYEEAAELWHQVLRLQPKMPEPYVNLSAIYINLGKFQEASVNSKKAMELDPDCKEAVLNYSIVEFTLGNLKNVISALESLLSKIPEYPLAMGLLSVAYRLNGERGKSQSLTAKIEKAGFNYNEYLQNTAKNLIALGRSEDAGLVLEMTGGKDPQERFQGVPGACLRIS